jgi:Kef-type K+ transport system membrane component KefB
MLGLMIVNAQSSSITADRVFFSAAALGAIAFAVAGNLLVSALSRRFPSMRPRWPFIVPIVRVMAIVVAVAELVDLARTF